MIIKLLFHKIISVDVSKTSPYKSKTHIQKMKILTNP